MSGGEQGLALLKVTLWSAPPTSVAGFYIAWTTVQQDPFILGRSTLIPLGVVVAVAVALVVSVIRATRKIDEWINVNQALTDAVFGTPDGVQRTPTRGLIATIDKLSGAVEDLREDLRTAHVEREEIRRDVEEVRRQVHDGRPGGRRWWDPPADRGQEESS